MINLELTPQRNDDVRDLDYKIDGDILTVKLNDTEEVFDFTGLPEGIAEEIEVENIKWNPLVEVKKSDGVIYIRAIRFYNETEREEFEDGYTEMEESGGDR